MKIVHIITRLVGGGADENTILCCNRQAYDGHLVTLICGAEAKPDVLATISPSVRLIAVSNLVRGLNAWSDLRAFFRLVRALRELKPDIVHTHASKAGILGRVAAMVGSSAIVVHGVHILSFSGLGWPLRGLCVVAEQAMAFATDAFVSVSDGVRQAYLENGIGRENEHFVVASGMDLPRFRDGSALSLGELASRLDRTLLQIAGSKWIIMISALEPRKQVIGFVEQVMPHIVKSVPEARLIVLGEGGERERVSATVVRLGLQGHVFLPGFVLDPERWIALGCVGVVASKREGLPRSLVQYLLAGLPVVATDLPGVRGVVRHKHNGFVVSPSQLEEMAIYLTDLLQNDVLRASMSSCARGFDASAWSTDEMVAGLTSVYEAVSKPYQPS